MIALLTAQTLEQPCWLGYLDTGASDVVFPHAPRTTVYYGYGYVLLEAGPREAAGWRQEGWIWVLPELMFPADRFLNDATLGPRTRRVVLGQDSIPPGHEAN